MKINNDLLLNFGAIVVNGNLPKYKYLPRPVISVSDATKARTGSITTSESDTEESGQSDPWTVENSITFKSSYDDPGPLFKSYEGLTKGNLEDFISKADAREFNIKISGSLLYDLGTYRYSQSVPLSRFESNEKELKEEDKEKMFSLDVSDIFDQVHIETGKEREFISRVRTYCELINKAHEMGQVAQEQKLIRSLCVHIYESVLAVSGFRKYIELSQLQELQKKCIRLLDLDYIANFTRIIPPEVAERKILADKLHVFDNYMVLHYDPTGATRELTEEEKQREINRRTDPVLFGVIVGSSKLYYIGDWVDEYCDLTWEQIVEKIGDSELK